MAKPQRNCFHFPVAIAALLRHIAPVAGFILVETLLRITSDLHKAERA